MAPIRVRILPGTLLPGHPPPPPSNAPPKPSHLCKIAVIGESGSGKSSVVNKFARRQFADVPDVNSSDVGVGKEGPQCDASAVSIGTSIDPSYLTTESKQHSMADYCKKDVTIWHGSEDDLQQEICIRVQVWDMNLSSSATVDVADDTSCARSINSSSIKLDQSPLISLLKRCQGVIISISCPPPPSTASFLWPELDAVENSIENWASFLCSNCSDAPSKSPLISILLTRADQIVSTYSPQDCLQLSKRMHYLCHQFNIHSWRLSSCNNTSGKIRLKRNTVKSPQSQDERVSPLDGRISPHSFDGQSFKSQDSRSSRREQEDQKRMLEDMEDGVEECFIELMKCIVADG
jgi:hypothetical protein